MMSNEFDWKKLSETIRKTINPEYGIPKDKETIPINYRLDRCNNLLQTITGNLQTTIHDMQKLQASLSALMEEIQPNIYPSATPKTPVDTPSQESVTDKETETCDTSG